MTNLGKGATGAKPPDGHDPARSLGPSGTTGAPSAACPLPDGALCGTCPDCQADAINDAQWPDGGAPVVLPEHPAAYPFRRAYLAVRMTLDYQGRFPRHKMLRVYWKVARLV